MINSPFGIGSFFNSRSRFSQPTNTFQPEQNQHDFSGWGDRLNKIEQGITSLTDQFKNFQSPMEQEGMDKPLDPEPLGEGIGSLETDQPNMVGDFTSGIPGPTPSKPAPVIGMGDQSGVMGQSLTRRGPLSLTEKLQNEYLMETKGPLTMGEEWDARQKEMGFDFRKQVRQLDSGEWAGTGQGADHFNKLFEEAGGVLDRPEHGAAARYGEGFTDWLGGQGYQVYTEPQQEWMTQGQQGLGALGQQQDMSWYTPHLSQYAMTGEEMKDPTGTLKTRMANLYQPSGNDVGGLPPGLEGLRGGKLDQDLNNLSGWQQQQGTLGGFGARKQPPADLTRALQAGVGALQGTTQQKIQQGYTV